MFFIELKKSYWIDKSTDSPDDLCLHGDAAVNIGAWHFNARCTVSAAALHLLKTITENHLILEGNQMLPCCGHFLIPDSSNESVTIYGCPNGIDWTVLHVGNDIEITTKEGITVPVEFRAYTKTVYAFADRVQAAYENSSPKRVPQDTHDKTGYVAFWNE